MDRRKTRRESGDDDKDDNDKFCLVCDIRFDDSSRHYASLQHTIMRNMRHEQKTAKRGMKKLCLKRREYREAIRRASLKGYAESDDSNDERGVSVDRHYNKMNKDNLFVLKALNSPKVSPFAYNDGTVVDDPVESSQSTHTILPFSSQSNHSCQSDQGRCLLEGPGTLASREGPEAAVEDVGEEKVLVDDAPNDRDAVVEYRQFPALLDQNEQSCHDEYRQFPALLGDDPKLKKEVYDKISELGSLFVNSGTNFVLCLEKPSGEKCWSISGPKLEADVFTHQFGIERGDVLVDVLTKRNRDLELTNREFLDGVEARPPWIDEDFDEFPEVPDLLATRTLLVERINHLVEANALEDTFRQFGIIDNIIVNYDDEGSAFALLFFAHVAMAYDAKMALTGFGPSASEDGDAAESRPSGGVLEISYLHLEAEQTRGKVIRLVDGSEPNVRKKVILEEASIASSILARTDESLEGVRANLVDEELGAKESDPVPCENAGEEFYDGISGWKEVEPSGPRQNFNQMAEWCEEYDNRRNYDDNHRRYGDVRRNFDHGCANEYRTDDASVFEDPQFPAEEGLCQWFGGRNAGRGNPRRKPSMNLDRKRPRRAFKLYRFRPRYHAF